MIKSGNVKIRVSCSLVTTMLISVWFGGGLYSTKGLLVWSALVTTV